MANGENGISTYKGRDLNDIADWATSLFNTIDEWPPPDDGESVAFQVLVDFDLPKTNDTNFGSSLPGYDVNNRDPYRMIQLSLAASAFGDNEDLKECYVNEEGEIDFYTLGEGEGISDIYYSIKTESYKLPCNNVVVTGCEIPPKRETRGLENLFTLGNIEGVSEEGPWYVAFGEQIPMRNEYQEGWIEYNRIEEGDRYLTRKAIWDVTDFERIITWIYNVKPYDKYDSSYSDMQFRNNSTRYCPLTGFGNMVEGQRFRQDIKSADAGTMDDEIINNGVIVSEASDPKFLGVRRVLIYGIKLNKIIFYHDKGEPTDPFVYIDTLQPSLFALRRGEDYVINKREPTGELIITFANNVIRADKRKFFGKDTDDEASAKFRIHPESIAREASGGDQIGGIADPKNPLPGPGRLRDNYSEAIGGQILEFPSVFPVGFGESGYAVVKLLVEIEWDNPCVHVRDTRNIVTRELLEEIEVEIFPIVLDDHPAPMAHNGELISAEEDKPDEDPTTTEIFGKTEKQQILDSLRGGDVNITLPFLNAQQTEMASKRILELRQEDIEEVTYVCGPECFPKLGAAAPEEGVINSITYSYQDNSQYVVNVQCGPIWQGMGGWGQSVNEAMTSQLSLEGMVVSAHKNNIDFLVKVNRVGKIPCINATKDIICSGDKVNVTVYNNPVGER